MDNYSFRYIIEHPHQTGIITFILGIVFVLAVYHFVLFLQNKDKTYLFYSLYAFFIFLVNLNNTTAPFILYITKPNQHITHFYSLPLMWTYNTLYFIFAIHFVNLKQYSKKWYSFILKTSIGFLVVIGTITIIGLFLNNHRPFFSFFNHKIVPLLFIFAIISYYPFFTLKMPFKKYIIVGSLILFITSLIGYTLKPLNIIPKYDFIDKSIFFFGVMVENIIFSLGLGHKQKQILKEKNSSQQKLIEQLQENEKLKQNIHDRLEQQVELISQQAEHEKFKKREAEYKKELAELKISSLHSQMNPHFIFNSLNAIKLYIIDNKKENAVYYLNKFSKLIRKILNVTREKEITLSDEIETAKLYLDIENIRFHNEINVTINVDNTLNVNTIILPSLLLQPFIENAIWHGLSSKKEKKTISLTFKKLNDNYLQIIIEDNGIGRKKALEIKNKKVHKKESLGLKITEERLKHFSKNLQNKPSITFIDLTNNSQQPIGTRVEINIPFN